jgi:hypothetical protein
MVITNLVITNQGDCQQAGCLSEGAATPRSQRPRLQLPNDLTQCHVALRQCNGKPFTPRAWLWRRRQVLTRRVSAPSDKQLGNLSAD